MAKETNTSINLLGTTSRVETPSIGIKIGDYVFGVYNTVRGVKGSNQRDYYQINPRFIESLNVKKINGTVNRYTLRLNYPITPKDDPNLLDKVFSSVSKTRDISFSYGDLSTPSFVYKEEVALITKVKKRTNVRSAVKSYTVTAVSKGFLNTIGTFKFKKRYAKPSDVIYEILYSPKYGLTEIFTGMTDRAYVERLGLISRDDSFVSLEAKNSISILDYLNYLVDMMRPASPDNSLIRKDIYLLLFEDGVSENMSGPYFRTVKSSKMKDKSTAYEIDIGYPSQNVVADFQIEDDETYAIYYDFAKNLQTQETVERLNDKGELEVVFCPTFTSDSIHFHTEEEMKTWWTKVTEYPIKATISFKGLLRPAVLMSHVRIRILWYGKPDMDSGLYIVTAQEDDISASGFRTTLSLLRIGGDDTYVD